MEKYAPQLWSHKMRHAQTAVFLKLLSGKYTQHHYYMKLHVEVPHNKHDCDSYVLNQNPVK
jgi:hypothetical protein